MRSPSERRVTLVDFRRPESCRGARLNAWGGEHSASAQYDAVAGALRLTFEKSQGTFSSPVLASALKACVAQGGDLPAKYYFTYRALACNGSVKVQFLTPEEFTAPAGFRRDGLLRELSLRPGGWNGKSLPFEHSKLNNLYFLVSGSGDLELYEFGAIYQQLPEVSAVDPTPVDVDAVALFPEPRIWRRREGLLRLRDCAPPRAVGKDVAYAARWFEREVGRFYGNVFSRQGVPVVFALSETEEGRRLIDGLKVRNEFDQVAYDGFLVSVTDKGIVVLGRDLMGVVNGVRTLVRLVHQFTGEAGEPKVGLMALVDWPRLKNRMLHQMISSYRHVNRYDPDRYVDMLERFSLEARFNLYSFELGEHYRYDSVPGSGMSPQSWTRHDFEHVVDRLNASGARVVPFVQSPGHQEFGIFNNATIRPDLREDGSRGVMCTRHPDTYPFLFGIFDEVLGICSRNPDYAPEIFYAGGDEVRWKQGVSYENRCRYCRDYAYNRLYVDHIRKVSDWVSAHGLQMLMCSDMIVDNHNGLDAFKCAEIRDEIPNKVAYLHWDGADFDMMEEFAALGHDNWKLLTGFQESPVGETVVKGYGLALYTYNWWLNRTRAGGQGSYGLMAMSLTGELAWGEGPKGKGQSADKAARWGNFLMRNWSRKPIPRAARTFTPVSLQTATNVDLDGSFDYGAREIAHVPVRFCRTVEGRVRGVEVTTNGNHLVFVKRRASSLVLLHSAHLPERCRKQFYSPDKYRDWTEGPTIANLIVRYADGTSERCPVCYGWNVGELESGTGERAYLSRYLADSRFVWQGRGGKVAYQYEWVNPHPDREIDSLELASGGFSVDYVLMALTLRDVKADGN